jgi:hypothetical protein
MRTAGIVALVLAISAAGLFGRALHQARRQGVPLPASACLHDDREQPVDRLRRDAALALARQINTAEGQRVERAGRYLPVAQLGTLSAIPEQFELRFYTDGAGYVFALKDRRDICRYAVFSDQDGVLYEKTPQVAQIAAR